MTEDRSRSRSRDRREDRGRSDSNVDLRNPPADDDEGDAANEGTNIYVSNLNFITTDESLRIGFGKFGPIISTSVIKEPGTGVSRGFGFVKFEHKADADAAVQEMANGELDGRQIRAQVAKRSKPQPKTPGRYAGPEQARVKGNSGGYDRGGYRDRYDDRVGRDYRGGRDDYRSGAGHGYGGGGGGGGRGGYNDRDRERAPPPRYDDRRGGPARYDDRRRSPPRGERGRSPPRARSPPRYSGHDDRRGGDRGGGRSDDYNRRY